jgi:hypothetical protein
MKRLLLAFFILIVVVGFFYLYEIRGKREKKKLERVERVLYEFQDQEIVGFTLSFQDEIVEISKEDDLWWITKPVQYPADPQMMEKFITALHRTTILEFIDGEGDFSQYQLDPPLITVIPRMEDQSTWATLSLGGEIPLKGGYFASLEGKDSVLILSVEIEPLINASLFGARDKNLLPYSKWDITSLKIKTEKGEISFQKGSGGWDLIYPVSFPASEELVSQILSALEASSIERFVDEHPSDLNLYHLMPPRQSISFKRDTEEAWYHIFIGNTEKGLLHARRSDQRPVFLIGEQILSHIVKSPEGFREKRISRRNRYSLNQFQIKWDGNDCAAKRDEEGEWLSKVPETKSYLEGNVYALLASILEIKAVHFLDREQWEKMEKEFSEPKMIAEISGDQFHEEIVLMEDFQGNIYAKNSAHPSAFYQISQKDLDNMRQAFQKCCGPQ